jgi:hypothetical protein
VCCKTAMLLITCGEEDSACNSCNSFACSRTIVRICQNDRGIRLSAISISSDSQS